MSSLSLSPHAATLHARASKSRASKPRGKSRKRRQSKPGPLRLAPTGGKRRHSGAQRPSSAAPVKRPSGWQSFEARALGGGLLAMMLRGFMTVAALTLLAKAMSFFKDAAVAHRFGVSDALDAFMLAFGVHSFAVSLLGGIMPEAFLPVYAQVKHERGARRAERLGVQTALGHLVILGVLGGLIALGGPSVVSFLGHGFPAAKQALALRTLLDLLPFLLLRPEPAPGHVAAGQQAVRRGGRISDFNPGLHPGGGGMDGPGRQCGRAGLEHERGQRAAFAGAAGRGRACGCR